MLLKRNNCHILMYLHVRAPLCMNWSWLMLQFPVSKLKYDGIGNTPTIVQMHDWNVETTGTKEWKSNAALWIKSLWLYHRLTMYHLINILSHYIFKKIIITSDVCLNWGLVSLAILHCCGCVCTKIYGPNVSTTPITAMGCRQFLPLSVSSWKVNIA